MQVLIYSSSNGAGVSGEREGVPGYLDELICNATASIAEQLCATANRNVIVLGYRADIPAMLPALCKKYGVQWAVDYGDGFGFVDCDGTPPFTLH